MFRYDDIYVVVTVGARVNSYRLLVREPRSLKQNEYCYKLTFETDMDAWKKRIEEVKLPKIIPPEVVRLREKMTSQVEKSTPEKVLDRLAGR